jgi:hypothetical protein
LQRVDRNSFMTIFVNPLHPASAATAARIRQLACGDGVPDSMTGAACMNGRNGGGAMGGRQVEQTPTLLGPAP